MPVSESVVKRGLEITVLPRGVARGGQRGAVAPPEMPKKFQKFRLFYANFVKIRKSGCLILFLPKILPAALFSYKIMVYL